MKKINWKRRIKRWDFWVAIAGAVIAGSGIAVGDLTSWTAVGNALLGVVTNPVTLVAVIAAIHGVVIDPTTKGSGDSARVLLEDAPVQATDTMIDESSVAETAESEAQDA